MFCFFDENFQGFAPWNLDIFLQKKRRLNLVNFCFIAKQIDFFGFWVWRGVIASKTHALRDNLYKFGVFLGGKNFVILSDSEKSKEFKTRFVFMDTSLRSVWQKMIQYNIGK